MPRPNIFSREFWRTYWVAIRRSRRDRRDLKATLLITAGLLAFGVYYGTLIWKFLLIPGDLPIAAGILLLIGGVALLGWISMKREKRAGDLADENAVDQVLRARLAADGFFVAVLLSRAASEELLKEKVLPEGVTIITRRVQIDKLRELGKWDVLPGAARDLLLLPDGQWSQEQILSVRPCFEILRCLRWVLKLDSELTPLTSLPRLNYKSSQQLFEHPEKILHGKRLLPVWDVRVERNRADQFFGRCYAEAVGRGLVSAKSPELEKWASDINEMMRQPDVRDVLAGVNTVSELDERGIRYLISISFHRFNCLQLIMALQDGAGKWSEWEKFCFPHPAPAEEKTIETSPSPPPP